MNYRLDYAKLIVESKDLEDLQEELQEEYGMDTIHEVLEKHFKQELDINNEDNGTMYMCSFTGKAYDWDRESPHEPKEMLTFLNLIHDYVETTCFVEFQPEGKTDSNSNWRYIFLEHMVDDDEKQVLWYSEQEDAESTNI